VNQEFVFLKCRAQIQGKRNTLLHRRLHWEVNAANFFFKPWARKPAGDSSSKENALLHHRMQQTAWVVCGLFLGFFFFFFLNQKQRL